MENTLSFTEAIDTLNALDVYSRSRFYAYSPKQRYGFFVSMWDKSTSSYSVHFVNAQTGIREPVPKSITNAKDLVIVPGVLYSKNEVPQIVS